MKCVTTQFPLNFGQSSNWKIWITRTVMKNLWKRLNFMQLYQLEHFYFLYQLEHYSSSFWSNLGTDFRQYLYTGWNTGCITVHKHVTLNTNHLPSSHFSWRHFIKQLNFCHGAYKQNLLCWVYWMGLIPNIGDRY